VRAHAPEIGPRRPLTRISAVSRSPLNNSKETLTFAEAMTLIAPFWACEASGWGDWFDWFAHRFAFAGI